MRHITLVLLLLGALVMTAQGPSGSTKDWPGWRGPNRDGVSHDTGLLKQWETTPPLAWKASHLGAGFSSLAIVGDRIYTMGDRGADQFLVALSRADGIELWAAKVG